jgi:hypothetical protein
MQEQWRDIPGFEGFYQASNLGRIRSVDRDVRTRGGGHRRLKGQIMRINTTKSGYHRVTLRKEGTRKAFFIHKLVALTWLGPYPPGQQVRHGPNGHLNNSVENLCYGTPSENALDRIRDGTMYLTGKTRKVRRSDCVEFPSIGEAARETNCDASNLRACCRGDRYKTVGGYGWEYIQEAQAQAQSQAQSQSQSQAPLSAAIHR